MKIVISGASGLIGSALVPQLRGAGHRVTRLVRGAPASSGEEAWQSALEAPSKYFDGADAVIHLGGAPVATRWTAHNRALIRSSRIDSTRQLSEAVATLTSRPRVFLHASAIGLYGDRGVEVLTESSQPGSGFLAEVCRDWEAAAATARAENIRTVALRLGIVLTPRGGALKAMLPPFRCGVGGPFAVGRQWWSWIALDDAIGAIMHALHTDSIHGPINVVAPQPLTNRDFAHTLGATLHRPAVLPLPAFAIRAAMGQMGEEALLWSQRVAPKVLCEHGFKFQHPELGAALSSMEL